MSRYSFGTGFERDAFGVTITKYRFKFIKDRRMKNLKIFFFTVIVLSCAYKKQSKLISQDIFAQVIATKEFKGLFNQTAYKDSVLKMITGDFVLIDTNAMWNDKKISFLSEKDIINKEKKHIEELPPLIMEMKIIKNGKNEKVLEIVMLGNNHFVRYQIKNIKEGWRIVSAIDTGVY